MKSLSNLSKFKIPKKELKLINGGTSGTNQYFCVVQNDGAEYYSWTCHAPSAGECRNPVGIGIQACINMGPSNIGNTP